jgi:hypothetical protein
LHIHNGTETINSESQLQQLEATTQNHRHENLNSNNSIYYTLLHRVIHYQRQTMGSLSPTKFGRARVDWNIDSYWCQQFNCAWSTTMVLRCRFKLLVCWRSLLMVSA